MKKFANRKVIEYLTMFGSVFSFILSVIMFSEFNDIISARIFWVISFISICIAWQIDSNALKGDSEETFSKMFENKKLFFEDYEGKRSPISYVDEEDDNIIVFKE